MIKMLSASTREHFAIRIGTVGIPQKYGAKVRLTGATNLTLSVSILGPQDTLSKLNTLEKGKLYEFESQKYNGIVQIDDIKITPEKIGDKVINHFFINLTRKSR